MKHVNSSLAKRHGKPLSYSDGEHTQSKTSYPKLNPSIQGNKNTKTTRIGYGVNGVGKVANARGCEHLLNGNFNAQVGVDPAS